MNAGGFPLGTISAGGAKSVTSGILARVVLTTSSTTLSCALVTALPAIFVMMHLYCPESFGPMSSSTSNDDPGSVSISMPSSSSDTSSSSKNHFTFGSGLPMYLTENSTVFPASAVESYSFLVNLGGTVSSATTSVASQVAVPNLFWALHVYVPLSSSLQFVMTKVWKFSFA